MREKLLPSPGSYSSGQRFVLGLYYQFQHIQFTPILDGPVLPLEKKSPWKVELLGVLYLKFLRKRVLKINFLQLEINLSKPLAGMWILKF